MNRKELMKILRDVPEEAELFVFDDSTGQDLSVLGVQTFVQEGQTYCEIMLTRLDESGGPDEEETELELDEDGDLDDLTESGVDFGDGND